MPVLRRAIKRVASAIQRGATGRPTPNTPKAGYTSDGRRYGCGGKIKKKKR